MPRLLNSDMQVSSIPGLNSYQYSGVKLDRLENLANDYTLVTIAVDKSSSVLPFRADLTRCLKTAVEACRKSPRAQNLLIRVIAFSSNVEEIHGFKPLDEIDLSDYDQINPYGSTALYDASASSIGAMTDYGKMLIKQDYGVNGIIFVITDGDDNVSSFSPAVVKKNAESAVSGEVLESFVSVLIGVNAAEFQARLQDFQIGAGITEYKDAGDATPGNLAKLASFVSRSVSSQANALGTGVSGALASAGITI